MSHPFSYGTNLHLITRWSYVRQSPFVFPIDDDTYCNLVALPKTTSLSE